MADLQRSITMRPGGYRGCKKTYPPNRFAKSIASSLEKLLNSPVKTKDNSMAQEAVGCLRLRDLLRARHQEKLKSSRRVKANQVHTYRNLNDYH